MKIKALKTIVGSYGRIIRDGYGEVDAETGKKLITKGYAVEQDDAPAEQETAATDDAPQDGSVVNTQNEPGNAPVADPVVVEPVSEPFTEAENAPKTAKRVKKEKPDADNEGS